MPNFTSWLAAAEITTPSLVLEPLRVEHAPEAVSVLDDVRLHTWTGGSPLPLEELRARYRRQSVGHSPDGGRGWLNWVLRRTSDGQLVGTVQATLYRQTDDRLAAELAWVIGTDHQGNGYGREGALALAHWLRAHDVDELVAHIHPEHQASMGIARAVGLAATGIVRDGEIRWSDRADHRLREEPGAEPEGRP